MKGRWGPRYAPAPALAATPAALAMALATTETAAASGLSALWEVPLSSSLLPPPLPPAAAPVAAAGAARQGQGTEGKWRAQNAPAPGTTASSTAGVPVPSKVSLLHPPLPPPPLPPALAASKLEGALPSRDFFPLGDSAASSAFFASASSSWTACEAAANNEGASTGSTFLSSSTILGENVRDRLPAPWEVGLVGEDE